MPIIRITCLLLQDYMQKLMPEIRQALNAHVDNNRISANNICANPSVLPSYLVTIAATVLLLAIDNTDAYLVRVALQAMIQSPLIMRVNFSELGSSDGRADYLQAHRRAGVGQRGAA